MNNILNDITREIPSISRYRDRPLLSILKYIDIILNGDKGFIKLDESEDLNKTLLKKGFYDGKINNLLTALNLINNSFNKSLNDRFPDLELIDEILNKYEGIYGWHPENKFLFPCNRYGNYSIKVIIKLMESEKMKEFIKDDYERYKFILKNQIYIVDEKPVNNFIYLLLVDIGNEFNNNIFTGEFLYDKFVKYADSEWGINNDNKFTAIFCDPEHTDNSSYRKLRSTTNVYIYQKYILKSIYFGEIVIGLTPANWMQTNSNKLKPLIQFRDRIKIGEHLKLIEYHDLYSKYVKSNDFLINNGGLSYFIYDTSYKGECEINNTLVNLSKIDIIPTSIDNLELIYFLRDYCHDNGSLKDIYDGSSGSFKSDDNRLFSDEKDGSIKVITSVYSKNFCGNKNSGVMFCDYSNLNYHQIKNLDKWKVLIPETCTSAGKGLSSSMTTSRPGELYTNTFGVFVVNNEECTNSLISYLKTDFVDNIISKIKIKNHINKYILEYIPNLPLDRIWDNEKIVEYLDIKENLNK